MTHKTTRRRFLQTTAATGIGYWIAGGVSAKESKSPNEQIAMACVGIGGKGSSDSADAGRTGRMVAICDVDIGRLNGVGNRFPGAKKFTDFREMLDKMGDKIDAVTVSTPDHTHTAAALMAMRMGKHCFCQKPMTRTIYEARLMAEVAREKQVATQMGNQGTAEPALRKAAAMMRAGRLGAVSEVHAWTNRPSSIWPQGIPRPAPAECPPNLKWDLWLGPSPERPYARGYHPTKWRGWWDFGSGALGDMACHTMNMPFMGLDLRDPVSVQAVTSGHNGDSYPDWSIITYEFPSNDWRPALKMIWYDGGKRPDAGLLDGQELVKAAKQLGYLKPNKDGEYDKRQVAKFKRYSGSGCLVIGEKAKVYSWDDYAGVAMTIGDADASGIEFTRSPGHFTEWVNAIKGGPAAVSNFPDYAGSLTETVLLGNLAVWVAAEKEVAGEKVEWDAKNLKSTNVSGLEPIIKPTYRRGYVLDV